MTGEVVMKKLLIVIIACSVLCLFASWDNSFLTSSKVTAVSAPPTVSSVDIMPRPAYAATNLIGFGDYHDPDGDFESGSTYRWLKNGEVIASGQIPQSFLVHLDGSLATVDGEMPSVSENVAYQPGKFGQGVLFTASNATLLGYRVAANFDPGQGTIEMWIKLREDLTSPLYDVYNLFFWYGIGAGNTIYIEANGDRITPVVQKDGVFTGVWPPTAPEWRQGEWHHIAFTWSESDDAMKLYYDGFLVHTVARYPRPLGSAHMFFIGTDEWGNRPAEAIIDEVRISNRSLTCEEIRESYHRSVPFHNGEVILPKSNFAVGDEIVFEYTPSDGSNFGTPTASSPIIIEETPIGNLQPSYPIFASGTTSFTLQVTTPREANCSWDSEPSTSYAAMPHEFESGQGTCTHATTITGLEDNQIYDFYIKCDYIDDGRNPDDYELHQRYRVLGPFNPDYPRIVNLWGGYDEELGSDFYANYDLLISGVYPKLSDLRKLNPHLKVLLTLPATYGDPFQTEWAKATLQDPEYNYLLRDSQGNILLESYWGHPMYNMTNITVTEIIAHYAYEQFMAQSLAYDGIFFDRVHPTISWMFENIDADQDGQADDPTQLDAAWHTGMTSFLERLRTYLPNIIIVGNGGDLDFMSLLNGREYEGEIIHILDDHPWRIPWSMLMNYYHHWITRSRTPQITFIMSAPYGEMRDKYGVSPWDTLPENMWAVARANYRRMRFGLTSTLLDNGLFGFDFGDTWHGQLWWYDEYDNAGRQKGYLGQPSGPAYSVNPLTTPNAIRNGDFEKDIASYWNFWVNTNEGASATLSHDTTTAAHGSASAKITVNVPASLPHYVSLQQPAISVAEGREYTLSFWAKASASRSIRVEFQKSVEPWTGYGLSKEFSVPTAWQEFRISFIATATASDAKLSFNLAAAAGDVWLDDIRLQEGNPDVYRRDFENGIVLVNATGSQKTINLEETFYKIRGTQAPLDQIIIDDNDPGFAATSGWITHTASYGDFGNTYHSIADGDAAESATWTPEIAWPGEYEVFVWYTAGADRTSDAIYTIYHDNGTSTIHVNQTISGTEWTSLGHYPFSAGKSGKVILSGASAEGKIIADAIKLESIARFNDGAEITSVTLQDKDGVILLRRRTWSTYLPLVMKKLLK
jgi:hypothetical protein